MRKLKYQEFFGNIDNGCIYIPNLSTWETVKSTGGRQMPIYALFPGDLLRFTGRILVAFYGFAELEFPQKAIRTRKNTVHTAKY